MTRRGFCCRGFIASLLVLVVYQSGAQSLTCREVNSIAQMARAKSAATLSSFAQNAGNSYTAKLIHAFRLFEIDSNRRSAAKVLSFIPPKPDEEQIWHSLDGFLCEQERMKDVESLADFQERLPHIVARAVLLVPEKMSDYVAYAYTSVQDLHSDYAEQMTSVCRARHKDFLAAVEQLPQDDREWFIKKIFEPQKCRALALPEAE